MKKPDPIQYLTGFLMGAFFGFMIEGITLILCGLLYSRLIGACPKLPVPMFFLLLPLPLIMGLIVGKVVASMHLEDY